MAFETHLTVRFGETDANGHVNNASYFIYLEQARIEFLKALGVRMQENGLTFVLASTSCDFLNPAFFDQILRVETIVDKVGTSSAVLSHLIYDETSGSLIARGRATVVMFDMNRSASSAIPKRLREKLIEHTEKNF